MALAACEATPLQFNEPDPTDDGSGDVPARVVAVRAVLDSAGMDLATTLGWQGGVPGAQVGLRQLGSDDWVWAQTGEDGIATFEDLRSGRYRVAASRVLTPDEAQEAAIPVRAFGDGRMVQIGGNTELTLELLPDLGGGLVISELAIGTPPPWEVEGGRNGGLAVEIYNGSADVVYLDGMLLGVTFQFGGETANRSCLDSHPFRQSRDGVFSIWFQQFPGDGSQYPLMPGEAAVIAEAAIDHRPAHPDLPDLRDADFEIVISAAGNNPGVPDMADVGILAWPRFALHSGKGYFLADPLEVSSLSTLRDPLTGTDFALIPAHALRDVVTARITWPDLSEPTLCLDGIVHRTFDRLNHPIATTEYLHARRTHQRRFLRFEEDGRAILQNTNTSAVDFVIADRNLGAVPDS